MEETDHKKKTNDETRWNEKEENNTRIDETKKP